MRNKFINDLLKNSKALQAIIGNIGDAISIQDAELRVLYQNDAHRKLIGDHAGEYCYKGFHRRDSACEGCILVTAFQDGRVHTAVRTGTDDKGSIFAYMEITASPIKDANGAVVAGIEVARNITDRIKTEQKLSESKQLFEDVAEGIAESILLLSKEYKVLWANKAASQQTGLAMNELIGNYCYKATHQRKNPCEPPHDPCPVAELRKTGHPGTEEHVHYDKNGKKVLVELTVYPIKDAAGEIVRFVYISKDITERKRLEQEREELILELQDALAKIRTLKGLIPICVSCKKIRDDSGYWEQIESYICEHSEAEFSHGICPSCANKLYPDYYKDGK
jgi:PAS domain S-box-containing protein